MRQTRQSRGMASAAMLASLCGMAVLLTLVVPLARFYLRSLHNCSTCAKREKDDESARVRLRKAVRKDLGLWRKIGTERLCMLKSIKDFCTHSDAADLSYGGTVSRDLAPDFDKRKLLER